MENYPYTPPPPDNVPAGYFPAWNEQTLEWEFKKLDINPLFPDSGIPSTDNSPA